VPCRIRRISHLLAQLTVIVLLVCAGCGGDEGSDGGETGPRRVLRVEAGLETLVLEDRRGDVRKDPTARLPRNLSRVDLTRVALRRDDDSLRVTFETARAPARHMMHEFVAYDDRVGQDAFAQVRQEKGVFRGYVHEPGGTFRPTDTVDVTGRRVTIDVPLNEFTRQRIFKWTARTIVTRPNEEIVDGVPGRPGRVAFFPRARKRRE